MMISTNDYSTICNIVNSVATSPVKDHKKGHMVRFCRDETANGSHLEVADKLKSYVFEVKVSFLTGRSKSNMGTKYGKLVITTK